MNENITLKMADDLKAMRIEAGFTQKDLGKEIGLSRETVVAIERKHEATIQALKMNTVQLWFTACRSKVHQPLLKLSFRT